MAGTFVHPTFRAQYMGNEYTGMELTEPERQFVNAALNHGRLRWDGEPDVETVKRLVDEDPHVVDRIGERILRLVCGRRGTEGVVSILLEHDVHLEIDEGSYNVLHEAAWANAHETLRAVFENSEKDATGVSVKKAHTGWPDNVSLMYWAAYGGFPKTAKVLLQHGVGVHHELKIKGNGERGTTSLNEAVAPCHFGNPEQIEGKITVAKMLLEDGAHYDVYTACALDDVERLSELAAENEAVFSQADEFGMTPLHWAARAEAISCLTMILEAGAPVNVVNKNRRTPLHLAVDLGRAKSVQMLAEAGADLDLADTKGRTPLHRATYEGQAEVAEVLLASGADPTLENKKGKTAFEIARKDAKYFKQRIG